MKSTRVLPLLALVGATGAFAQTAPPQTPPGFPSGTDPGWLGATCANDTTSDAVNDVNNGGSDVNLVGDLARPAGSVLTRGDFLFIRLRLDASPGTPGNLVSQGWSVAMDRDGDLRTFEHLFMVNGKNNLETIEFAANIDTSGEINASNQIAEQLLQEFPTTTFTRVEPTNDGNIDGEAVSDRDHWLIFAIPWRDPIAATVTLEDQGYSQDNTLTLWFGSSNSSRNLSLDISCAGTLPTPLDGAGSDPIPLDPTADDDNDTIPNFQDNCRFVANTNQANGDGDDVGDACDVAAQTTPEDVSLTFSGANGNRLQVTHLPEGTTNVTLSVDTGVLSLAGTTGLTFTVGDGTADATMTFTGLRSAIDTALNGLSYTPPLNFNGAVTLTFRAGRVNNVTRTNRVAITVTPVDDAPVNTVPGPQTINEDTPTAPLVLAVADIDSATLTVTLTSVNGTARLATTSGLTSVTGDGTATITLVGTLAALNTAMNGVRFTPTLNFNGAASLTMLSAGVTASDQDSIAITVNAVNDAPSNIVPGTQTTLEDNALLFGLATGNQLIVSDVDSGQLTVTVSVNSGTVSLGGIGGLTFSAGDGTDDAIVTFSGTVGDVNAALEGLRFTPALHFNSDIGGLVTLSLTSNDLVAAAVTSTVTIDVDPVNDAPVAVDDSASTDEDTPVLVNVVNNDTDVDNNVGNQNAGLTVTAVSGAVNGSAVIEAGQVRFTPTANFNGTATFDYTVSDGLLTDTGTVTITVIARNDAPVANADSASTDEDVAVTVDVLANDTDVDNAGNTNAGLSVTGVRSVVNGTAEIVAGGVRFTPTTNFNGTGSFIYDISDGNGGTASASVTITVNSINDAPDAVDDSAEVIEDTATPILVLANDSDVDGDDLIITAVSSGRVTIAADGKSVTYTPALNSNADDSFTYTVRDPSGATDTATVTITIDPVNDAPLVFVPGDQETDEDSALFFTSLGVTPNGISVADVDAATLTVTLTAENGTIDIDQAGGAIITGEGTGIVTITGTAAQVNAALEGLAFLPNDDLNSRNDDFSLTVSVDDGDAAPVEALIDILVNAVNDAPTGGAITASTDEDTPVVIDAIDGAVDVDNDPLVAISATQPAVGGSVNVDGNGVVTFTPATNFNGTATFDVVVSDGNGGTVTRTVTVTVDAVNDAPVVLLPGAETTDEDTALVLTEDNNDIVIADVDGDTLTVTLTATNGTLTLRQLDNITITDGANGTAFVEVTGTAAAITAALENLTFTPTTNFNGAASIQVVASDGPLSDTETLGITVLPVNDAPVAADDSANTDEDTPVVITVLGNDVDVDGDELFVTAVSSALVVIAADGKSVTYTPALNATAPDTFTYTVSDRLTGGLSDVGTVNVTINAVNDGPVLIVPGTQTPDEDTDLVFAGATGIAVVDVDGDEQTVTVTATNGTILLGVIDDVTITAGAEGTGTVTFTGSLAAINAALDGLTFVPTADFNGAASITVTTSDGALSDSETIGISVQPVNDAPVAVDDRAGAELDPILVNVLANDTDVDVGDVLSIDSIGTPVVAAGSTLANAGTLEIVVINGRDQVRYTPTPGFNGSFTVEITITDGQLSDTSILTVGVSGDRDLDGVPDVLDNCVDVPNTDQTNTDGDDPAVGDACDPDDDDDGIPDTEDNCDLVQNVDQINTDLNLEGGDLLGDACDDDDDADGVPDTGDNCRVVPNADQTNTDVNLTGGDLLGDACDDDDDADGDLDVNDNCVTTPNADQLNSDTDALGDACDDDDDNDGDLDGDDNCPLVPNADQVNTDLNLTGGDALGDACDDDDDADGDPDVNDNCVTTPNADQLNSDTDALGDACDPDDDNDGVPDGDDNCPVNANADQLDTDSDDLGNVCDDDDDNDTVPDGDDNCQFVVNLDQADLDNDGIGNVCDDDDDGDGGPNGTDNCPGLPNPDQRDTDGDGLGDACDDDDDGDGDEDGEDNCPLVANADQTNTDGDANGDACDDDDDNDGDNDGNDNCPLVQNADQANNDGDALGDACDDDDDNDGEDDGDDNCPFDANANQSDIDNDGLGDACDDDRDGDGVNDVNDNCPDDRNADQVNTDGENDGGDACDDDDDNDGVFDGDDNCSLVPNEGQENSDGDDDGDACDGDADGDGVENEADNCEFAANADQSDIDLDGIGDVCDDDSPFAVGGGGVVSGCGQTDAPSLGLFGLAALALLPLRRRRRAA